MECYCVASKKPIRREKTKPQTAIVIVCGFQVSMHAPIFTLIFQYTILLLTCQNPIKSLQFFYNNNNNNSNNNNNNNNNPCA